MRKIKLFVLFSLFSTIFFGQTTIKGLVSNKINESIPYTNILVKSDSINIILTYTYSKENGEYVLNINKLGKFSLTFSSLGYKTQIIPIEITKETKIITKNIVLKEEAVSLNEVIIQAEKLITIKKDTVVIKVSKYIKLNDVTVEDLLKKIPGVTVNSEGTIKVGNQEIEKLMIDGDDFFERGYKILSKNMPPDQIEKIELLQKYSNNKLLKDIEESDKVALNLVLKDDAKRQWFGNFSLGYDVTFNNRYSAKSYLMNFGKKNKYIFLTNFNNIGYDVTGDINHLIRPFRYGEPASIGDNQSAYTVLNLNSFTPNFKASRTNFNNAELASLNAIFTLSKKVKLKTLGFFNWDENDFFRNRTQTFTTNGTDFTNTEDYILRKKKFIGFGKIDLIYDIAKTKTLEVTTKYNNQEDNDNSNLVFNTQQTIERLNSRNTLFDQKITYTNKFKTNKVFLLTGRYIDEKTPQNYTINQFFYQDLFSSFPNVNNVQQLSENKMQFAGFEAHLLDRKENGNLLEIQFGNQYRKDNLLSSLVLKEDTTVLETPTAYQNNTTYFSNDLYMNTKYRVKLKDVAITGKLDFHQLFNQLEQNNPEASQTKQQPFFINPKISFDWEINKKNKILASYAYNTTNAKILDVYNNYILTGFRSFSRGLGTFNQLDASTLNFNYQLGDWSDKFFANAFIVYNKNRDFFSTNSLITQNYSQSDKIIIKDREMFTVFTDINRYFKTISSNLKFDIGFSKSNYKNIVNNSDLREVNSTNYNYGFELRSGFQGVFNYHFGSKWTTNKIKSTINNSFTNNVSFLDLSFDFNSKFNVQLQTERYFFGNTGRENNTYYFADLEARYKLKKNKLTFSLSGKNLFNTETFKTYSISDISTSTTEYRLLPRYLLLKMVYRF
ncbi:MAG: carboxypeptidase-like regulatory domain-containing protein [Flavobacteriaceae bacterium]|nr:carboxypeptidase-like regulatory domain-containing protein [Flavobacteriaceae bacterium]